MSPSRPAGLLDFYESCEAVVVGIDFRLHPVQRDCLISITTISHAGRLAAFESPSRPAGLLDFYMECEHPIRHGGYCLHPVQRDCLISIWYLVQVVVSGEFRLHPVQRDCLISMFVGPMVPLAGYLMVSIPSSGIA